MSVKKNIIAGWITHAVVMLIGFFLMPFVLRTLGEGQYGAWVFINAVAGYAGLVYAGFGTTICRYVADLGARKDWAKINKVASSIQAVYFCSAAIAMGLAALFAYFAPSLGKWGNAPMQDVQLAILLVGVTIGVGMVGSVYGGVLIGMQRLDVERGIQLLLAVVRLTLIVTCLKHQHGLVTLGLVFLAVIILEQLLYAWFAYRQVPTLSVGFWNIDPDVLRECFGFSVFNAIAQVAEQLIYFTDTVVVGIVLGREAVVPYFIGSRIAQMIRVPIAQIGEAVLPRAGVLNAAASKAALARLVTKGMGLAFLLASGFFIGTAYFGGLLIQTWIGKIYAQSPSVLCILIAAQAVSLPASVVRKALVGSGEVRIPALIDLLQAILNLILSLIFVQFWGIIGVAWGTFLPVAVIEVFVLLPYAARNFGVNLRAMISTVIAPQILPLLSLLVYCEAVSRVPLPANWFALFGVTIGGGAVLGLALLAAQLTNRRVNQLQSAAGGEQLAG